MSCFLSYSSHDAVAARALYEFLTRQGEEVFFAAEQRDPRLFAAISEALDGCSRFIYLNSESYLVSEYCRLEWTAFISRYGASQDDLDVIGVMLDAAEPPPLLRGWLYVAQREVGADPAAGTAWMEQVLARVRQRRVARAANDEKLSGDRIAALAAELARAVLGGPANADLLDRPLLERQARHRTREGVIFLKPEGTFNARCIETVVARLLHEQVNVVQARKYTGGCIAERGLFDQHYFGPAIIARQQPPELGEQELARLQAFYFDRWQEYYGDEEEPGPGLIIPALCLLQPPYRLSADDISEIWDRGRAPHLFWNERPDGLNKIGFQKSVFAVRDPRIDGGRPRLVLNGYVPGYKKLLEEPADEVRVVCLRVATDREWGSLRDDVLGGDSNPAKCRPGTLRRQAFENQEELGIDRRHDINGQQNLLHASATPLEGIHEIGLWFDVALDDTYLGAFLANRLGAGQLPDLFFRFHEFLNAARGKDIEELVREALERVPPPDETPAVPGFEDFRDATLARFEKDFVEDFGGAAGALQARLWAVPAIRRIVEIGYAVRRYGPQAMVEKFLSAFAVENRFFRQKCRQFCNLVAHIEREQLEREPELIGLAVRVVCSDLLILSHAPYPDDFVDEFLTDLHERAREIARRTRANAVKQCAAAWHGAVPAGEPLSSLPLFEEMRRQRGKVVRINVGKGMPGAIAIVTAGGRSTRVQSIIPKPVLRLRQKFLIEHVVDNIREAFGGDVQVFISVGWESELVRACLGNHCRYLTLAPEESRRNRHLGLGPGARLYAALQQLEPFAGPILACYSDMPMVQPGSLQRLAAELGRGRSQLCFLTVDNAPLPGHVVRGRDGRVERVAHSRYGPVEGTPERDAGFYMFSNTPVIREALGAITNANVKREYGIHELVEAMAARRARVETVKITAEECWTVNNASDLFWLAAGLYRDLADPAEVQRDYESFQSDYGATFDGEWFARSRLFLRSLFNPVERPDRPDLPLHFVTSEVGP